MADPYAQRDAGPFGREPSGEPPWLEAVASLGTLGIQPDDPHLWLAPIDVDPPGPVWTAIVVRDAGPLPPVARLSPSQARLFDAYYRGAGAPPSPWRVTPGEPGGWEGVLALKHGWVAGPPGSSGSVEVTSQLLLPVLEAIIDPDREIVWEQDLDFGYEVPAVVEGLDEDTCRVLCPRLHYADHDRVYEHAELVAETKRRWFERLSKREGVTDEALAATGWPPRPTGERWREHRADSPDFGPADHAASRLRRALPRAPRR